MADQVSLMASGELSASLMKLLMIFLACGPGRPVVSSMKGTRLMSGYLSNFALFSSSGPCVLVRFWLLRPETGCKRKEQQW